MRLRNVISAASLAALLAWSAPLAAFLAPLQAQAAVASGTLVKASTPAVYYVGADGKRYVFPNQKTYLTWYANFAGVVTITDAELASMQIGGNATYRPGVKMVKITTDPKVYAVDHGGALRWVKTEAAAKALYGANWNQKIDDVPDAFFVNYTIGADISSTSDFDPAAVTSAASSINVDKGLTAGGSTSGSGSGSGSSSGNATLTVTTASTPSASTAVRGSQAVPMLGIVLRAGSVNGVTVSGIHLVCSVDGNLDNVFKQGEDNVGELKKCTDIISVAKLWNGSSQLGGAVSPATSSAPGTGGDLNFNNFSLTIPANQTVTLTVKADLAGSIANLNDQVRLSVTGAGDVAAVSAGNGSATVAGPPVIGPIIVIAASGSADVVVAPSDSSSEAGTVVGNGNAVVLAKYRLTAQNEDLALTKVRLRVASGSAIGVKDVMLLDGQTVVGGPVPVASTGFADLTGLNVTVPRNGSKTLTAAADLNAVGPSGAPSGTDLTLTLDDGDDGSGTTNGTFEIRGTAVGSSTLITHLGALNTNDSMVGNQKVLRKTVPTVATMALPGTVLTSGTQGLFRFTIAADPNEQVSFRKITFHADLNDNGGSALDLSSSGAGVREVGSGSNIAGAVSFNGGSHCSSSSCDIMVSFSSEQAVAPGDTRTFELRATVSGADRSGESVSTMLLGDGVLTTGQLSGASPDLGVDGLSQHFIWSDNSVVPHNDDVGGSKDWTGGLYVKNLPSDTETLSR